LDSDVFLSYAAITITHLPIIAAFVPFFHLISTGMHRLLEIAEALPQASHENFISCFFPPQTLSGGTAHKFSPSISIAGLHSLRRSSDDTPQF
jgi:hypothetical protein